MDEHHRWQLQLYESLGKAREPSGDRLDRLETDALASKARPHSVSDFVDLNDTPAGITNGDLYYGSSNALVALGIGSESQVLKTSSGIPAWSTAGSGGLVLEATDTADGTAEHLQVSATSTPSSIKRMIVRFQDLIPEVDTDQFNITAIDEDDTEITTAVYNLEGFIKTNAVALAGATGAGASNLGIGTVGNAANEYFNIEVRLLGSNGSATRKHFWFLCTYTIATGVLRTIGESFSVDTSKSIKGMRIDTDNAGDMINAGTAEMWVQT